MDVSKKLIVLFFIVFFLNGLENINLPPLDGHAWRQTLTITMAKGLEMGKHWSEPYTIIGETTEILGAEFPVFHGVIALFYQLFGFQDWYGRLLNWIVTIIGLWYFRKIITLYFSEKTANLFTIFMSSSIIFEFARKTMPDTFAMSLGIIGSYYAIEYLKQNKIKHLVLGIVLLLLCGLAKLPYLLMWTLIGLEVFKIKKLEKPFFILSSLLLVNFVIIVYWYFVWVPYLVDDGALKLFWNFPIAEGLHHLENLKFQAVENTFKSPFHNIPLTFLALTGLGFIFTNKKHISLWSMVYLIFTILLIIKSGTVYPGHDYYVIPLVPIFCLGLALLLEKIPDKFYLPYILAFIFSLPGHIYNKKVSFSDNESKYLVQLKPFLKPYVKQDTKLLVNGGALNPIMMYWSGQKGVTWKYEDFKKLDWVLDLKNKGMIDFVVQDKTLEKEKLNLPILAESEYFILYETAKK